MQTSFERARAYLATSARPLEQALANHHFDGKSSESVIGALCEFQNKDGGFGNAIEPDIRMSGSSVLSTTVGLQVAVDIHLNADHPIVTNALDYLADQFDTSINGWHATPRAVNDSPHAPWWQIDPTSPIDSQALSMNPGIEAAAYFVRWGRHDFDDWLSKTLKHASEPEHHQLLCLTRLLATPNLSDEVTADTKALLTHAVENIVETDVSKWADYCLKPLTLFSDPTDFLADRFFESILAQIDYERDQQTESGAWLPTWQWGDQYPGSWNQARQEWSGVLTLDMAKKLEAFGTS